MKLIKETSKKIKKALLYPNNKKSLIPNWLSFSRMIGALTIPILININASLKTIINITVFVTLSDFFDGKLARILNAQSDEGALIDAISDKLLSASLIIGIIPNNKIFIINGILESIIAGINAKKLKNGENPVSNLFGKIKMWPLYTSLGLGYIGISLKNNQITNIDINKLMNISTALSIITIPLELINIKDYLNNTKLEKNNHKVLIYEKNIKDNEKKLKR